MAVEDLSPEQLTDAILGGYRAAGNVYRAFMDVLEARHGKEDAAAVAREVVRLKGETAGKLAAAKFGRGSFANLRAAHEAGYPTTEILEYSPTRYVARDYHCAIVEGWRKSGVSEARIRELAEIYCWGDLYFARAFNPKINLEFESRIAEGSPCCRWIFTLDAE